MSLYLGTRCHCAFEHHRSLRQNRCITTMSAIYLVIQYSPASVNQIRQRLCSPSPQLPILRSHAPDDSLKWLGTMNRMLQDCQVKTRIEMSISEDSSIESFKKKAFMEEQLGLSRLASDKTIACRGPAFPDSRTLLPSAGARQGGQAGAAEQRAAGGALRGAPRGTLRCCGTTGSCRAPPRPRTCAACPPTCATPPRRRSSRTPPSAGVPPPPPPAPLSPAAGVLSRTLAYVPSTSIS